MRRGLCVREQRTEALGLETKLFSVFHCERRELLLVVIRGINATLHRGRNRQIVRFSEREHSPRIGSEIWLSTLEHYRKGENLHADQRDSMEGRLKLDAAPFLVRSLTKSGVHGAVDSISAKMEVAISSDPWVYCTALWPGGTSAALKLARRLSPDYDTITHILDIDAFAMELGIDFALALDPSRDLSRPTSGAEADQAIRFDAWLQVAKAKASIGAARVVFVDHGPVAYEDLSGVVRTGREVANLRSSAGFTKPRSFSYQSEYRFALRTIGEPSNTTLRLPVSDALRALTSIHPCGAPV